MCGCSYFVSLVNEEITLKVNKEKDVYWIIGYGSLMHPYSLKRTVPDITIDQTKPVRVVGYRRIFNLTSVRSWKKDCTGQQAAAVLNIETHSGSEFGGVAFPVGKSGLSALDQREYIYRRMTGVECLDLKSGEVLSQCNLYTALSGEELRLQKTSFYEKRVRPYGLESLVSKDILPIDQYLSLCLQGAYWWGEQFGDHFVRNTFLGDAETPLSAFLTEGDVERRLSLDLAQYIQKR